MREESGVKDENLMPVINAMQASLDANQDILGGQRILVAPQRRDDKVKEGKFTPGKGRVSGNRLVYYTEDGTVVPEGAVQTGTVPTFTDTRPSNEQGAGISPTSGIDTSTPAARETTAALVAEYSSLKSQAEKDAYKERIKNMLPSAWPEFERLTKGR